MVQEFVHQQLFQEVPSEWKSHLILLQCSSPTKFGRLGCFNVKPFAFIQAAVLERGKAKPASHFEAIEIELEKIMHTIDIIYIYIFIIERSTLPGKQLHIPTKREKENHQLKIAFKSHSQ